MEAFWIGSTLYHCRCYLRGDEDKNDGKCSPSLEMLRRDGNTMDAEHSASSEMLKEMEIQRIGSAFHCLNHITLKSCFADGEHFPLPLPICRI
jgi:hypothetical protein